MKYSYIKWTKLGSDFMFFFLDYSPNMLLSGSRDKTLIIWNLTRDEQAYGYPKRSLEGHSHIVSDCVCPPNYSVPTMSQSRQEKTFPTDEGRSPIETYEKAGLGKE